MNKSRAFLRRIGLALAGLMLAGCAAQQSAALLSARPADIAPRAEIEAVPFFPQTDYQCGPAALATSLGAVGIDASPAVLAEQVFLPSRAGTLQTDMLVGARRRGAVATLIPPTLEALLREVSQGQAVVVLQNLGLKVAPRWHYAVVVGYDLDAADVLLRSGTHRREVMSLHTFEHTWARSGHWGFVALPPGQWPATAQLQAVIEAAIGFEQSAPAQAQRVYETALIRWPNQLILEIGLGNAVHASGDKQKAAEIFDAAARRHDSKAAWVNLAAVLLEMNRRDDALAAARHALDDPQWGERARSIAAEAAADAKR